MNAVVLAPAPVTALEALLLERASRWAAAVAPGRWTVAPEPPEDLRGPVILVSPDAPRLGEAHAEVAKLDLEQGVELSVGPTFGGGLYLVAMSEPRLDLLPADWTSPDAFSEVIRLGHAAGLELGWVRMERAVSTEADREALRVDPVVPAAVRALL